MKVSNIWKAWITTIIGALIPVITGILTAATEGQIDWTKVKASLVAFGLLALTDLFKEVTKAFTPEAPEVPAPAPETPEKSTAS